mmetsp:Transcript_19911/g.47140  ORF Transcript_19911/g.47140 Transcript_19911/m.47140 type:complete len:294 (-) Transcript_19911:180-1061(-)
MQAVAKRAAPLAVGVGTAAVSLANSTAECRSAVVVTKEQLEEACGLIKNDLSKGQALTDSSPWMMCSASDSQDFDLLELSASVAADPAVQRVLQEKYEEHGLSSLSIQSWPSSCPSSPAFSLLLDGGIELESENAILKEENERLKQENERLRHDREATPLHLPTSQEPSKECSKECSKEQGGELRVAPGPDSKPAVSLPSAPPLAAVLRLHLEDGGRVCARLGTQEAQGAGRPRPRKSQRAKERQRQAVIIATAIVVGVLAITITKSPAKAKVAAASAAAAITSLMSTYARTK